jgi:hypothetical protein
MPAAFRYANWAGVVDLLREFGDTNPTTTLVGYLKTLEAAGFEQFSDFPMHTSGRTIAFVRQHGFALAVLSVESSEVLKVEVIVRTVDHPVLTQPTGFSRSVRRIDSAPLPTYRIALDVSSGLMAKLFHIDSYATLADAWWSLDDSGNDLRDITIGCELVRDRERFQCDDYNAILRLIEERRAAVPNMLRYQFDADHRFKLVDILERGTLSTKQTKDGSK